jgi:hypothetical protein
MNRTYKYLTDTFVSFLAGGLVFSGLWLFDEILTEAMYCGRNCLYPFPLIGSFTLYGAEGIAWLMIIGGILLLMGLFVKTKE